MLRQTSRVAVTLTNPSEQYYFNIDAPRFLVKPESLPPSKYLFYIPDAFREYLVGAITFVKGLVIKIEYSAKSVLVTLAADLTAEKLGAARGILICGVGPLGVELGENWPKLWVPRRSPWCCEAMVVNAVYEAHNKV
ncbi:hypothetical protein BJX96DRAFT_176285 [Aspergillus floccosus]